MVDNAQVYRDSAGHLFDAAAIGGGADTSSSMLPTPDFTDEQKAMARLPLPFRNIIRDPFMPVIGATAKTTAYPQPLIEAIMAKGCSSFRIINPNGCAIRFRSATGPDDLIQENEGRLIGPWGCEVFSTQNPTHLSVMAVARPGLPVCAALASPELNYGIGG